MTCCFDCTHCLSKPNYDIAAPNPTIWGCELTRQIIDPYGLCEHFEEEPIFEDEV